MVDTTIDCKSLRGRKRDICRGYNMHGQPVLTENKRRRWLLNWGYDPQMIEKHLIDNPSQFITPDHPDFPSEEMQEQELALPRESLQQRRRIPGKGCGGCSKRKAALNKLIPGAGDVVEAITTATGIKAVFDKMAGGQSIKWTYGITTTPQRIDDLFPRTLNSLKTAGFEKPWIFVDGLEDPQPYHQFDAAGITVRHPNIRTHGNWVLSLYELYIRTPDANRYALFQDDFITYNSLREYLETCEYPDDGYWNLYTFPENQRLCPDGYEGWYKSNQRGKGAVALVFSLDAVTTLLGHDHMIQRPKDTHRGYKAVDGGIVTAMKKAGYREYVHNPSLVQHTGTISSMGNKRQALATSFRGEEFNCLELIPQS